MSDVADTTRRLFSARRNALTAVPYSSGFTARPARQSARGDGRVQSEQLVELLAHLL